PGARRSRHHRARARRGLGGDGARGARDLRAAVPHRRSGDARPLVLASVLAPLAAHRAARITQQTVLTTRAGVSAQSLEILDDATSLRVEGRLEDALTRLQQRQAEHDAAIDRAAVPAAVASAAVPLTMILAVSGSLLAAGSLWVDGGATAGQIGILLLLPLS